MKSTVVPAQITTVEDRIAGNFTFTQIVMLMIPLISSTAVYVLILPHLHFSLFKLILIGLQFLVFGVMAIRIKGKIIIDWLVIYLRFSLRPRIYVFTKNDQTHREIIDFEEVKVQKHDKAKAQSEVKITSILSLQELVKIDRLFNNPALSFRYDLSKKGGINVSVATNEE